MRAIIITLAAAFSASAFAFDAPDLKPAGDQQADEAGQEGEVEKGPMEGELAATIKALRASSAKLQEVVVGIRAKERGEGAACADDPACFDGYISGFATRSLADVTVNFAEAGDLPMTAAYAEVAAHQAAFAYDAWKEVQQEARSPQVCQAVQQSALAMNAAISIVEQVCEDSESQTCFEYPADGAPRAIVPECGSPGRPGPRGD